MSLQIRPLTRILQPDSPAIIDPCDGTTTFCSVGRLLFAGYFDDAFTHWRTDYQSNATLAQPVLIHELIQDSTFAQVLHPLLPPSQNLDDLGFTQNQIIGYIEKHSLPAGWLTCFLFKVKNDLLVARANIYSDNLLGLRLSRFDNGWIWPAKYNIRFIIPDIAKPQPSSQPIGV